MRSAASQPWAVLAVGLGAWLAGGCNHSPTASGLSVGGTGDDDATAGSHTATDTSGGQTPADDSTSSADNPSPPLYDVGGIPDVPPPIGGCGGGGGGGPAFSFIWIANSGEGTVSKIDTVTLEEVGRYATHPTHGDPSRTSVNLNGDVAVANRNGGLVKFFANPAHCVDHNANGSIDTSTGPDDVLAWDDEECRAWFTPFEYQSQRPVAWTAGQWNASACRYDDAMVWTSGANDNGGRFPGKCFGEKGEPLPPDMCKGDPPPKTSGVDVVLVDGNDGMVVETTHIPEVIPNYFGLYGGAVDAAGNFWGSQLGQGSLVRVNLSNFDYAVYPMATSGYGMTVDAAGYVWTCSGDVGRFDPDTETWQTAYVGGNGGCMEDGKGTLWLATNGLVGVDTETLQVVKTISLGGGGGGMGGKGDDGGYVHGVSVDFQGFVWGVSMGTTAYRVDPVTQDVQTVTGLTYPYTYSDMTGFALANAGGWTPAG